MAPPVREGERLDSNPLSLIFRQQQEISARLALRGSSPRWWVNARETGCEKTGGKKKKKKKGVSLYNCSFLSCSFVQLESTSYNIAITFECSVELAKFLTAHRGATAIRKKQSPLDFLSSYPFLKTKQPKLMAATSFNRSTNSISQHSRRRRPSPRLTEIHRF